jgi:hypothetical protein
MARVGVTHNIDANTRIELLLHNRITEANNGCT